MITFREPVPQASSVYWQITAIDISDGSIYWCSALKTLWCFCCNVSITNTYKVEYGPSPQVTSVITKLPCHHLSTWLSTNTIRRHIYCDIYIHHPYSAPPHTTKTNLFLRASQTDTVVYLRDTDATAVSKYTTKPPVCLTCWWYTFAIQALTLLRNGIFWDKCLNITAKKALEQWSSDSGTKNVPCHAVTTLHKVNVICSIHTPTSLI